MLVKTDQIPGVTAETYNTRGSFPDPVRGGKNKAPRSESAALCRSPVHFTGSPGPNPVCGNFRLLVLPGSPRKASSLRPGTSERRRQAFSVEAKTRVPKEKYII